MSPVRVEKNLRTLNICIYMQNVAYVLKRCRTECENVAFPQEN